MATIDGTGVPWPKIDGEIDDLKALEFARRVCLVMATSKSSCGVAPGDAELVADQLNVLIETARSFEDSVVRRLEFMETMLRKDGLAVVVYLEADRVRDNLRQMGRGDLARTLSDQAVGLALQELISDQQQPPALTEWARSIASTAAANIVQKAVS